MDRYSPEERRRYTNEWRSRRRNIAKEMLGGKCLLCGKVEDLEFDHIDPSTKVFPIGKMWTASKKKFLEELAKCQLLCGPCHLSKSKNEGSLKVGPRGRTCVVVPMEGSRL